MGAAQGRVSAPLSSESERRVERRQSVRVSAKGTVSIRANDYDVRGRVGNVCSGGVSVVTLVTAPERVLGRNIDVELRFDTQQSAWIHLPGRILRIGATSIAIGFDSVPTGFDQLIDDALTASHGNDRVLSLVIIDATLERRLRMAEGFRAAGCAVVDVSTPLEAIVRLGEFHFEPDVIAVADSLPSAISGEMRTFVEREHPRAKLVTIGDDITELEGLANWLSSMNPDDNLPSRIRELLTRPARRR
ncbi:MAG: PilZ domain-containing protein [Polyangiales bacterium]